MTQIDDEYETNWHHFDELHKDVDALEDFIRRIEAKRKTLHRKAVKEQNEIVIEKAKELHYELWVLRRCCDQSAG